MSTAVEVTNWPNGICEAIPARNWYTIGEYVIDINSIVAIEAPIIAGRGTGIIGVSSFVIHTPASIIEIRDKNAEALRLGLINVLETTFGRIRTVDACPF